MSFHSLRKNINGPFFYRSYLGNDKKNNLNWDFIFLTFHYKLIHQCVDVLNNILEMQIFDLNVWKWESRIWGAFEALWQLYTPKVSNVCHLLMAACGVSWQCTFAKFNGFFFTFYTMLRVEPIILGNWEKQFVPKCEGRGCHDFSVVSADIPVTNYHTKSYGWSVS